MFELAKIKGPCEVAQPEVEVGQNATTSIIMMVLGSNGSEKEMMMMMMVVKKKMKPKWGFIFQINEYGLGYSITARKETKGGPNNIDYSLLHPPYFGFPSNNLLILPWLLSSPYMGYAHMHVTST